MQGWLAERVAKQRTARVAALYAGARPTHGARRGAPRPHYYRKAQLDAQENAMQDVIDDTRKSIEDFVRSLANEITN